MTQLKMEIDWKAYFEQFLNIHGSPVPKRCEDTGEVIELVFQDGWRYKAMTLDHGEIPPPNNHKELKKLKEFWVSSRTNTLQDDLLYHQKLLEKFSNLETTVEHPLLIKSQYLGEVSNPLDLEMVEEKIALISQELEFVGTPL